MKVEVLIENPPAGGQNKTSLARAKRFERSGRAQFVAPLVIRFLDTPQQRAVVKTAEQRLQERITGHTYDSLNESFFRFARGLPLIHADNLIRNVKSTRDWSYRVAVRPIQPDRTPEAVATFAGTETKLRYRILRSESIKPRPNPFAKLARS